MKIKLIILLITLFVLNNADAQTRAEILHAKKIYAGTWYNKKEQRTIKIFFDNDVTYATINDWNSKIKNASIDAYKAFVEGNKLVIAAENDDHHAPYCQIEIINNKLIYQCNEPFNFTDNFLNKAKPIGKTIFVRIKK